VKSVALDVHKEKTQFTVALATGEIVTERVVETKAEVLRREVANVPGRKRVVLENNGWAAWIFDALKDVADEVIVCDPTRNKLISQADDSDDERDAERLGLLSRAGALHRIYVPPEPYRTLRSLVQHEWKLTQEITRKKLRLKAFCRRDGVAYRGKSIYGKKGSEEVTGRFPARSRFQFGSLFRTLDAARLERLLVRRELRRYSLGLPVIARLQTVPGIGAVIARTLVAWLVDPGRFKSFNAMSAYAGLGLKQDISNWRPVHRAHASKRGQRAVKAVLFLAARAAIRAGHNGFAERYKARVAAGWEDRKAIRDIARKILFCAGHVWTKRQEYDDGRINTFAGATAVSGR
jgi:transposase